MKTKSSDSAVIIFYLFCAYPLLVKGKALPIRWLCNLRKFNFEKMYYL